MASLEEQATLKVNNSLTRGLNKISCILREDNKLDWLPLCVDGNQYYVADVVNKDATLGITLTRLYKLGVRGSITEIAPTGTTFLEGYCTSTANTTIGNVTSTTSGSVAAGKKYVSFTCTSGAACTVGGVVIALNTTKVFEGYFDDATKIFKKLPIITYDATGGSLQINWVD